MDNREQLIYDKAELLQDDQIDLEIVQQSARAMLVAFGEDIERDGLQRTPERIARMYDELLSGYRADPVAMLNDALFEVNYAGY
jgi:GTP cyclohydrolase I